MKRKRCQVCARPAVEHGPPETLCHLCGVCYRRIYSGYDPPPRTELTAEQVEELVSRQTAELPHWWADEDASMRSVEVN